MDWIGHGRLSEGYMANITGGMSMHIGRNKMN